MSEAELAKLPAVFRYSEARAKLNEREFRSLVAQGRIIQIARGLYRKRGWLGDEELTEIAAKAPAATVCLRSALAHHDLIDDIPSAIDIALPRNTWKPRTDLPVRWHDFDRTTFALGRDELELTSTMSIGLYSPERSIVDAFRLRNLEGPELATEALKRWLRKGGKPSALLQLSDQFSHATTPIRRSLEILL